MSLTSHPYRYFSSKQSLLHVWKGTFDKLIGDNILSVFGVWNKTDNAWFDDAPMLVLLSSGTLFVNVKNKGDLAIGWNEILLCDKPIWFDKVQDNGIQDLQWNEKLEWKKYRGVARAFGAKIDYITPIGEEKALRGLDFFTINGTLRIENTGDVIFGRYIAT